MDLFDLLDELPVFKEAPWGKDVPAKARIELDYIVPLTKEIPERMIGYAFGTNKAKDVIYFSYHGRKIGNKMGIFAPQIGCPSLEVKFIDALYADMLISLNQ